MNRYLILVSIFIISLVYGVTCDDAEEVKLLGLNRARQRYRYNHPPAAENYEAIPVAIVYDKVIDRVSRINKAVTPKTTTEILLVSQDSNNATPTSTTETNQEENVTSAVKPITTSVPSENITTPQPKTIKLELNIPVSVVYDEEPEVVRRNRVKSGVSTRLRKLRRRKPNAQQNQLIESAINQKQDEKYENNKLVEQPGNSTLKPIITNPSNVEAPKLIPKIYSRPSIITSRKPDQFSNNQPKKLKESNENVSEEDSQNVVRSETTTSKISTLKSNEKKREHGEPDPVVPIIASENRVFAHNGEFQYSYEGGDGTRAFSQGKLKSFDEKTTGEAVEGGFSYRDKDGNDFSLSYTADENGYRPIGAHLPTPPPIPPAIARALAYLATKPTPEPVTEAMDELENTQGPNKKEKQSLA